ncbi:MAG: DNA repair protein RecN [Paludibacteraceae bacterium]|nr:DNA repair protein RecN [Paludibacteraceae bacterium]MBQ1851587.1 DNA repair protein RecN [Paludibacteraceae bacterium]MBQ2065401.1 DNA repair protein RecN [Paludibacteraceae bacterium]
MLKHLHIENYVLIKSLNLDFQNGFSVVTGQTGAGKSIILGALNLALGAKADTKAIFEGEKKCIIEAEFDIEGYGLEEFFDDNDIDYSHICIIRREITDTGKSRSFLNDTPVLVSVLKQLGGKLIDIHSQHSTLLLESNAFQLGIVDSVAGDSEILERYKSQYEYYQSVCRSLIEKTEEASNAKSNADYIQFQYNQLKECNLRDGEQQELEGRINTLEHVSDIKESLERSISALDSDEGILSAMHTLQSALEDIASFGNSFEELLHRVTSCQIELKDIYEEIERKNNDVEMDPAELESMQERMSLIYTLLQKHKVRTVEELIEIRDSLALQLGQIDNFDEEIEVLTKEKAAIYDDLLKMAKEISKMRVSVAPAIEKQVMETLAALGMPNSVFKVEITKTADITPTGTDIVQMLISSNKTKPQPIQNSASGGEISRVMLSLKAIIASNSNLPTLVFDEIDTGVSGMVASQMGAILQKMSDGMQVICITHLPQVAAKGEHHYKVFKDENTNPVQTYVKLLDAEERVGEIAAMLSGEGVTEAAINNAKELLNTAPAR